MKPAILVARGMVPDAADKALRASGGHLGPALEQIAKPGHHAG
ncbi:MAG: hypothetical protein Q4G36_03840 [Paracoccus sp. (in: a-proteobacteria)]|nr:hypothetical protein [Paracoccus sp. (in: a-proteobacteria)]